MHDTEQRDDAAERRAAITAALEQLNVDELDLVVQVVSGLVTGREVYGPLAAESDPRDFGAEVAAELRDGLLYMAMEVLAWRRKGARR